MSSPMDDLRKILSRSRAPAVRNLLAVRPAPFKRGDLAKIESELLSQAPEGANLAENIEQIRSIAIAAGTPQELLQQMPIAVEYPLPKNPLAHDLNSKEGVCTSAAAWLREVTSCSNLGPAGALVTLLVAAILEFRLLHVDYIPAILQSLRDKRAFRIHTDTIWAIPLSLYYGRQENAERRLLILRKTSVKRLREFLNTEGAEFLLQSAAKPLPTSQTLDLLTTLERQPANEARASNPSTAGKIPALAELIDAAQVMAILELPSVIAAHRSRQLVSHSLPPEALRRISGYPLQPFPAPRNTRLQSETLPDDPKVEVPKGAGEGMLGMEDLRKALDEKALDLVLLEHLASGPGTALSLLAQFAIYLSKATVGAKVRRQGTGCQPATVRRYCLLIATRVVARLGEDAVAEVTDDAWEDAVEAILDEDAFYHFRQYTDHPSSNAQTHSRPLVKAIRHWLRFLSERNQKSTDTNGRKDDPQHPADPARDPEAESQDETTRQRAGLADLARRLPVLGLIKVDACLITVDEYRKALRRLVGSRGRQETWARETARVALILGYRCGLRRAETAGLRVADFDRIDYLHVRPTRMRPLKTSNARRDLPLRLLIPKAELQYVRRLVWRVRRAAQAKGIPMGQACVFSMSDDPEKPLDFEGVVTEIHRAFRGDELRGWDPIDADFHYHRLRHSFANVLLLRLWPGLRRMAQHFFPGNTDSETGTKGSATRAWLADSDSFRRDLFGTEKVTEGDLQGIALLLGHGSAATSLEHYLHVLDWYENPESWPEA